MNLNANRDWTVITESLGFTPSSNAANKGNSDFEYTHRSHLHK